MNGAQIILECLRREGADVIFGYPGGAVLPLFDRLYDSPLRFILCRHEQAAAHAADGYARATGKVGICLATSGPGATNLTTGIANAFMDSIPVVALTGQVRTRLLGLDAFQEADIIGITRSITKQSYLVRDIGKLSAIVHEAFHIAASDRPGPVLIDIPVDIQQAVIERPAKERISPRFIRSNPCCEKELVAAAIHAIRSSTRPLIISGGGVITSGAHRELRKLAESTGAPVTTTLMGLGGFPATHPLSLGMLGMHGTVCANRAVMEADLIIAAGVRFDDRVTGRTDSFAPRARVMHIDIDPSSVDKNIKTHLALIGDARVVICQLLAAGSIPTRADRWLEKVRSWRDENPPGYDAGTDLIEPQYVIQKLYELTKGDAIIATEVGQNQMWTALWYRCDHPRTFITSGGLGAMGFGFPAAIGAKAGCPDKPVVLIAGDGSIQMNIQELATCVSEGIAVKVVVLNNGCLGMVRQWQELFYDKRYSHTRIFNPDFAKVAESFGAAGITVAEKDKVEAALSWALAEKGVVFVDIHVDPGQNVFPMVAPGQALNMIMTGREELSKNDR